MITLDVKTKTTPSSPLNISTPAGEESTLSFSELLKGSKDNAKATQNGIIVLALDEKSSVDTKIVAKDSKINSLLSLLKNDESLSTQKVLKISTESSIEPPTKEQLTKEPQSTIVELNPKVTQNLSVQEVKSLVADAKEYLKSQIIESEGYIKSEAKELPKTLKGLAILAQKFDIDVSKITIQEIQVEGGTKKELPKELAKEISKESALKDSISALKDQKNSLPIDIRVQNKSPQTTTKEEEKPLNKHLANLKDFEKPQVIDKKSIDVISNKENSNVKVPETLKQVESVKQTETLKQVESVKQTETLKQVESVKQTETLKQAEPVKHPEPIKIIEKEKTEVQNTKKVVEEKIVKVADEIKSAPTFIAQKNPHLTTQQIIQVKQFNPKDIAPSENTSVAKSSKSRADETLQLLLRGEKPTPMGVNLTQDFSVATAKVMAPTATSEATKSLEKLLSGEQKGESSVNTKVDISSVQKTDNFEVKLNEAKQMVKYLSNDVKNAIEDYKSPFTRIKVQLNPQKLGEIDLTVVQRGNNLHVTLSSNNAAINTLVMNANELRQQLANSGINNATLNFNNQSDGSTSQQNQQQQNSKDAQREYTHFENEEKAEEILSSLEIVVPQYI